MGPSESEVLEIENAIRALAHQNLASIAYGAILWWSIRCGCSTLDRRFRWAAARLTVR